MALRSWLKANNLSSDAQGGGDVSIVPQENAQNLEQFKLGQIAGAWARAVGHPNDPGGQGQGPRRRAHLWSEGRYVTTT